MQRTPLLLASLAVLSAAGCGGSSGGSGGAVTGLSTPGNVAVVTPVVVGGSPGSTGPGAGVGDFPPGADYFDDVADVSVYDPAMEPLDLINEILCMMAQTRADAMVNLGPYKAQINTTVCEQGSGGGNDQGQSSGAPDEIEIWVVNALRSSEVGAQTVSVWVPNDAGGLGQATIHVSVIVEASPDADYPFGIFEMDFAGVLDAGGDVNDPIFFGTLGADVGVANNAGFSFYMEWGDVTQVPAVGEYSEIVQVNVQMTSDQTAGVAKIHRDERYDDGGGDSGIISRDHVVAFDTTHFVRATDGGPELAYDRTDFVEHVWSYNLYEADGPDAGQLVDLNGGFGFETAGGDYGYVGYYGIWMPEGVALTDGEIVTESTYGEASPEQFVVVKAPGKLIENTLSTVDLTDLEGESFNWWDAGTTYQIQYSLGLWSKIASWNEVTSSWDPIVPPQVIDTAAAGVLNCWSDSLGGSVDYVDGDAFVTVYNQEFVNGSHPLFAGGATEIVLFAYLSALDTGITGAEAELGDVYMADSFDVGTPLVFRFQLDDLTLYHDVDGTGITLVPVGLAPGEAPTQGPNEWGMTSGPMVLDTAGFSDVYDVWGQTTFYTYETGHNEWNQYSTVTDLLGAYQAFDPPLQFLYQHSTADDRNGDATYDGKSFMLQYDGPHAYLGIPEEGVDLTGDLVDDRFYPIFDIADGTFMGPTGTEYVVKALNIEQTLNPDPTYSGSLTTATADGLTLPDASGYQTPAIGPKPVVNAPPAVIEGEVAAEL